MITNSVVKTVFKLLSEFKQSDDTIKRLFHEINLLSGTLQSLDNVATRLEIEQSSPQHTTRIYHINACDNTLRKIEAQLEKIAAKRDRAIDRARQRTWWLMSKADTEILLKEVECHKSSLNLALSVDEL